MYRTATEGRRRVRGGGDLWGDAWKKWRKRNVPLMKVVMGHDLGVAAVGAQDSSP